MLGYKQVDCPVEKMKEIYDELNSVVITLFVLGGTFSVREPTRPVLPLLLVRRVQS